MFHTHHHPLKGDSVAQGASKVPASTCTRLLSFYSSFPFLLVLSAVFQRRRVVICSSSSLKVDFVLFTDIFYFLLFGQPILVSFYFVMSLVSFIVLFYFAFLNVDS